MKDSDTEVKKSSAVHKILQHPANRREPGTEESGTQYEDARSRDNINLEFRSISEICSTSVRGLSSKTRKRRENSSLPMIPT